MVENIAGNTNFYRADNANCHDDLLNSALALYKKGEYDEALKIYSELSNYYTSPTLYLEMGNCCYKLGKNKFALEYWNKAAQLDNQNSTAFVNIGNLYYKSKDKSNAVENWHKALTIEPDNAKVCLNIAIAYTDLNMRSDAIKYYEKYLKYEKNKNDEYYLIENKIQNYKEIANDFLKEGAEFQKNNNYRAALDCYIKALAHYPNYSRTNFNIGSIFFMDHNYEQAIKYWLNSYFIDYEYPKTMLNLAISYDYLKKFDYAYCFYARYTDYVLDNKEELTKLSQRMKQLKQFISKNPYLIEKHLEKAEEFYRKKDLNNARVEYRNYIMLKPEDKETYMPILKNIGFYLNPEENIIEELSKKAGKLSQSNRFAEASLLYEKAMTLCNETSTEYSHLKAKYTLCVRKAGRA